MMRTDYSAMSSIASYSNDKNSPRSISLHANCVVTNTTVHSLLFACSVWQTEVQFVSVPQYIYQCCYNSGTFKPVHN